MYKKLVWMTLLIVLVGNINSNIQPISEHPIITRDNASQVELLHVIGGGKILDMLWSPDGNSLFVANQKTIRIFNPHNLEETPAQFSKFHCKWNPRSLANDNCDINLKFADNATTLLVFEDSSGWSVGNEPYLTYWDIASQHEIGRDDYKGDFDYYEFLVQRQIAHEHTIPAPLIINNNNLLLYDEEIRDYITLPAHSHTIVDAIFNRNKTQIASVGNDGIVEIWTIDTRTLTHISRLIVNHLGTSLTTVEFSPDSTQLAVGGWDGRIWIFDVKTGQLLQHYTDDWWVNWNITFNHDGTMLALGNDNNQVIVYDVLDDYPFLTHRRVFEGHRNIVYAVAFHPNSAQLASASADGNIHIWDIETGTIVHTLTGHPFFDVAFHPNATHLACAGVSGYAIVPITSSHCIAEIGGLGTVYSVAFNSGGTIFAYGDTNIIDLQQDQQPHLKLDTLRTWSDIFHPFRSKLTFSDDGKILLNAGTSQNAYVWHTDNWANSFILPTGLMALSPDGTMIAGNGLRIFDIETRIALYPTEVYESLSTYLYGYTSGHVVLDAVFSPDGRFILTAPATGGLMIWGIPK